MLENAGVPVPGETILLAAGFFVAQGHFHLTAVMTVAAIGAVLGDNTGYAIGHKIGRTCSAWLFGGIAEDVVHGDPLTAVDVGVSGWLHARTAPQLIAVMRVVTKLGTTVFVNSAALLVALLLLWRRQWYWLLTLVLAVPGGMLLNLLLKSAFHRHRPSFNDPILTLTSYSFPSGHTMAATVFYGVLATFA